MLQTVPCAAEAVNSPVVAFIPAQEDAHVAGRFAVNCCVCPLTVVALTGVIVSGEVTVTVAEALAPETGVAVTVQDSAVKGAVYNPVEAPIDPQVAAQLALPLDVNCCVAPSLSAALVGLIVKAGVVPRIPKPTTVPSCPTYTWPFATVGTVQRIEVAGNAPE